MTMVVAGIDVCKKHLYVSVDGIDRRFENDRRTGRDSTLICARTLSHLIGVRSPD